MKEMTDRELTDKISQVFDHFEDPSAAYGWQELRKKYPENNRKPLLLWWGAAAAVLLVVSGLWLMIPGVNVGDKEIAKTKSQELINKGSSDSELGKASKNKVNADSAPSHASDQPVNVPQSKSLNYANMDSSIPSQSGAGIKLPTATSLGQTKIESIDILNSAAIQTLSAENNIQKTPLISLPEHAISKSANKNPEVTRDSIVNATGKMLALAQQNPATDSHLHQVKETQYASQKTSTKNHTLSFYAGSYFNYSLGSETKLNFGAGFTSDIKLASNLKLSTGLALANNSLTYNNGVPSSGKEKLAFDVLPSFGAVNNNGTVNNNLTTITKYDASLLALDIPINIKYLIIPKDNKLYLLAGLSSGTYLAETYSLDYRNYSAAGLYVNQSQGIEVKKQLQAFDLARTLNISFGYSANLGKTQNITIEPFLKYPLGGLGSQNLKFGSTGVNLKLNFSQFKKR